MTAIDLDRIRTARATLDAVAHDFPELVGATDDDDNRDAWEAMLAHDEDDMAGRPKGPEQTVTLALRLGESLVQAIDAYREKLSADVAGVTITRNDAMRRLLMLGLEREGIDVNKPKVRRKS